MLNRHAANVCDHVNVRDCCASHDDERVQSFPGDTWRSYATAPRVFHYVLHSDGQREEIMPRVSLRPDAPTSVAGAAHTCATQRRRIAVTATFDGLTSATISLTVRNSYSISRLFQDQFEIDRTRLLGGEGARHSTPHAGIVPLCLHSHLAIRQSIRLTSLSRFSFSPSLDRSLLPVAISPWPHRRRYSFPIAVRDVNHPARRSISD